MSTRWLLCAALFGALLLPSLDARADDRLPVEVMRFRKSTAQAPDLGFELADHLRRALEATGAFRVVRSDLAKTMAARQKAYLSHLFDQSRGPKIGAFRKPEVLVEGRFGVRRGALELGVSFTRIETLESLESLGLRVEVPLGDLSEAKDRLAAEVMQRVAKAGRRVLPEAAVERARRAVRASERDAANQAFVAGRRLATRDNWPSLLRSAARLEEATEADPTLAGAWASLSEVEVRLARLGSASGREPAEASQRRVLRAGAAAKRATELSSYFPARIAALRVRAMRGERKAWREALAAFSPDEKERVETLVLRAQASLDRDRALELVQRAIDADPYNLQARLLAMSVELGRGNFEGVREHAELVLRKIDPTHPRASRMLAHTLYAQGEFTAARSLLERALARDPEDPSTLGALASAAAATRRHRRAEELTRLALEKDPTYMAVRRPPPGIVDGAIETWTKSIARLRKRWPTHAMLMFDHGFALVSSNDPERQAHGARLLAAIPERKTHGRYFGLMIDLVLAEAEQLAGRPERALALLEDAGQDDWPIPVQGRIELARARAHAQAGQAEVARLAYRKLLSGGSSRAIRRQAAVALATEARRRGEDELALAYLDRADAIYPARDARFLRLGIHRARHREALEALGRAPNQRSRAELLALARAARDEGERALSVVREALELYAGDPPLLRVQIDIEENLGHPRRAARAQSALIEISPPDLLEHARALAGSGQAKAARALMDRALADSPADPEILDVRSTFLIFVGDRGGAARAAADALQLEPTWPRLERAAQTRASAKDRARAQALLRKHAELAPARSLALAGELALEAGDRAAAATFLEEARTAAPSGPVADRVRLLLGRLAEAEEKPDAALEHYRAAQRHAPSAEACLRAAKLLAGRGEGRAAIEAFIEHLRRDPESEVILATLVKTVRKATGEAAARKMIERWVERLPESVLGHVLAAKLRLAKGELETAEAAVQDALQLDPERTAAYLIGAQVAGRRDDGPKELAYLAAARSLGALPAAMAERKKALEASGVKPEALAVWPSAVAKVVARQLLAKLAPAAKPERSANR